MQSFSIFVVVVALGALSCDLDGRNGGPDGPATRFCRHALEKVDAVHLEESCRSCCTQEVPYVGKVENAQCTCYP
jgi:hypothetical protein